MRGARSEADRIEETFWGRPVWAGGSGVATDPLDWICRIRIVARRRGRPWFVREQLELAVAGVEIFRGDPVLFALDLFFLVEQRRHEVEVAPDFRRQVGVDALDRGQLRQRSLADAAQAAEMAQEFAPPHLANPLDIVEHRTQPRAPAQLA